MRLHFLNEFIHKKVSHTKEILLLELLDNLENQVNVAANDVLQNEVLHFQQDGLQSLLFQ